MKRLLAPNKKSLTLKKALEHMRTGSCMIRMNGEPRGAEGANFYIVPGGLIEPTLARSIMNRPDVKAGKDGLFPDHDQTWRMLR